jgi:E3 ubiquitin-protein ligase CBL
MAQKFIQTNKVLNKLLSGNSSTSQNSQQAGASQQVQVNSNSTSALSLASMLNSPNDFEKLERKHFDKVYKLADKSLKYCQSEKMNLTNSPPYIIDILPDICQILNGIYNSYDNKLHILNDIEYFMVYIFNLISKFEKLIHLFKQAGKRMYEDTSDERKQLIKYSLIFSHILTEIKSLFPNNIYDGQNFRIAKSDAAEFWKNNFNNR